MSKRHLAWSLFLAVTLALAACGGATKHSNPSPTGHANPSPSPSTGVFGIAVTDGGPPPGPTPSPLPSGFGISPAHPLPHYSLVIEAMSGLSAGHIVARVRTDAQGIFRLSLPPGRYVTYHVDPREAGLLHTKFTVRAGAFTRVVVWPFAAP